MPEREGTIWIRSFDLIFRFERRIHKIGEKWRVPLPYGLPLRGLIYGVIALLVILVLRGVPVIGDAVAALPHPMQFALMPGGVAWLLTRWRVDGRPAHRAGLAYLRARLLEPGRLVHLRRAPAAERLTLGEVAFSPDEAGPRYPTGRVVGACTVHLRYPAEAWQEGSVLRVRQTSQRPMRRGKRVELAEGQELVFEVSG